MYLVIIIIISFEEKNQQVISVIEIGFELPGIGIGIEMSGIGIETFLWVVELELELKTTELELELNWKNGIDPNPAGKAAGPSGIIVEMLKAAGSKGIVFLRELTESVVKHGKIPEDWEMSFILNLYKGKGDALTPGNYRGLKLTEHVMKVMERIVDGMIREMIAIDEMQFAFVPGRGTTDAIFIIRQLQEKFLSRKDLKGGGRRVDSASSTSYVQ